MSLASHTLPRPQAFSSPSFALDASPTQMSRHSRPRHSIIVEDLLLSLLLAQLHALKLANLPRPQEPKTHRSSDVHETREDLSVKIDVTGGLSELKTDWFRERAG